MLIASTAYIRTVIELSRLVECSVVVCTMLALPQTIDLCLLLLSMLLQKMNAVYSNAPIPLFDRDMKVKAVRRLLLSKLMMTQPPVVTDKQLNNVSQESLDTYSLAAKMNVRKMAIRRLQWQKDNAQYYATKTTAVDVKELSGEHCYSGTCTRYR